MQGSEKAVVARHEAGHAVVGTAVAKLLPGQPRVEVNSLKILYYSHFKDATAIAVIRIQLVLHVKLLGCFRFVFNKLYCVLSETKYIAKVRRGFGLYLYSSNK